MNYWTWICPECGESVPIASQSCPKCGCPQPQTEVPASDSVVTAPNGSEPPQSKPVRHPQKTFSFRISAIVSLLLGLGIIAFGYKTMTTAPDVSAYSASNSNYSASHAEFGGDFYTYIYDASDTMVDELNDINNGVSYGFEALSQMLLQLLQSGYYCTGAILIAIGTMTVAYSLPKIKKDA